MWRLLFRCLSIPALLATALFAALPPVWAQDRTAAPDEDGSSQQTEESDEAYRRRMELEDARRRDPMFTTPAATQTGQAQEKIDKLPKESRDNIRDQLVDVIMENGEWEPFDGLRDYPYAPTEAAGNDAELMQREQEAWDEQIEKYNQREAEAYAARRGPVPGPGNPTGEEGGQTGAENSDQGSGQQGSGQQGDGQAGGDQQGDGQKGSESQEGGAGGAAGTYQPYQPDHEAREDEVSTAGVQESALDFLRGQQGQPQTSTAQAQMQQSDSAQAEQPGTESAASAESDAQDSKAAEFDLSSPGIIPIEDLKKLEGADLPTEESAPAEEDGH